MKGNNSKKQISFRVPTEMAEELKAAAVEEGLNEVGKFARELLKWAFGHYKEANSLFLLKKSQLKVPQFGAKK